MKSRTALLISSLTALLFCPGHLNASENFLSNPTTPYPHGCATNHQVADDLITKHADIVTGTVFMKESGEISRLHEVDFRIWRRGCAEPGRALLMFDMTVIDDGDSTVESVPCPGFKADRFGVVRELRGVAEPNSWIASCQAQPVEEGQTITLFIDGPSIFDEPFDEVRYLTVEEYNGGFNLQVLDPRDQSGFTVQIPEYHDQHRLPEYPLNGRLSGTWVVPGAADQGFLLAIEELISEERPHLFFSWYTFDKDGNQLWLAGNSRFEIGDTEVEVPLVFLQNGLFLGSQRADRTEAGTGRIKAFSCNQLFFSWDLSEMGLGAGAIGLERLFAMEVAGFPCRDPQARLDSLD